MRKLFVEVFIIMPLTKSRKIVASVRELLPRKRMWDLLNARNSSLCHSPYSAATYSILLMRYFTRTQTKSGARNSKQEKH